MSPEVNFEHGIGRWGSPSKGDDKSFDVPDETGTYETPEGVISVDMSGVNPQNEVQTILIDGISVNLSVQGVGTVEIYDGVTMKVALHEPIRKPGEWRRKGLGKRQDRFAPHHIWVRKAR